jgi:Zn-dependent peptidase ImmA (M78 family)/transcriptional regulator with XRE-family HTH domain
MPNPADGVNKKLLRWARERAGISVSDAATRLRKDSKLILAWEDGTIIPTFRQLEYLAETLYKRPIALFFFPEPPKEEEAKKRFRTLPEPELKALEADTLLALREGLAFQQSLAELTDGRNPAKHLITRDIRASTDQTVESLSSQARLYLGVTLEEQSTWQDTEGAFKHWRNYLETVGVYILKRSFKQKTICGFCLYDNEYPLVVINNGTAHSRQTFTAFHELAHLLFRISGITKQDDYIALLRGHEKRMEEQCNAFAAEFLMPSATFPFSEFDARRIDESVSRIARRYGVSREAVLRRMLDAGFVDPNTYQLKKDEWNREFLRRRKKAAGGDYYATKATYLGGGFISLAFHRYHSGALDLTELARHLRVKATSVAGLEDYAVSGR